MKKAIRMLVIALISAGFVLGYYYYLSHRNDNKSVESGEKLTEVEKIITTDLSKSYPTSPRAVVKFYNRIIKAYYDQEFTDEELAKMAEQARGLFDDELRSYNDKDAYLQNVKADIESYKTRKKTIVQSSVSDSNDIVYEKVQGDDCAYVTAYYFSKEGSSYSRTYQQFVLRKDKQGDWKILTFKVVEGEKNDQ